MKLRKPHLTTPELMFLALELVGYLVLAALVALCLGPLRLGIPRGVALGAVLCLAVSWGKVLRGAMYRAKLDALASANASLLTVVHHTYNSLMNPSISRYEVSSILAVLLKGVGLVNDPPRPDLRVVDNDESDSAFD